MRRLVAVTAVWPMLLSLVLVAMGVAPASRVPEQIAPALLIHRTQIEVKISKVTLLDGGLASSVFDRVFFRADGWPELPEFATPAASVFNDVRSFTKLIDPAVEHLTEDEYPLRIEVFTAIDWPFGPVMVDIDPSACSFWDPVGCASLSTDRQPTDDIGLDLNVDLNTGEWGGESQGPFDSGTQSCAYKGSWFVHAEICLTVTVAPQPMDIRVTTRADDNGVCLLTDCSLREALLAAITGDRILIPAGLYELTTPYDRSQAPEDAGKTGHLSIPPKVRWIELMGVNPEATVIKQTIPLVRVFDIPGSAEVVMRNLTITGGASSPDNPSTAYPGHVHGGGIHNHGVIHLVNVTVTGNHATSAETNGAGRGGGGIYNAGTAYLTNVTVAGNDSPVLGAGLSGAANNDDPTKPTYILRNTLLVDNTGGHGNCTTASGVPGIRIVDEGGNLQYPGNSCVGIRAGVPTPLPTATADPAIGPVGPGLLWPLVRNRAAIDTANDDSCPPSDQLGVLRPQPGSRTGASHCDIGALEFILAPNTPPFSGIAEPQGGYRTREGGSLQLMGSGADIDQDPIIYRWSPGDQLDDATAQSPLFTAPDEGTFSFTLRVNDGLADSRPTTTTVEVTNVAPRIESLTVTPPSPVPAGTSISMATTITDPGVQDSQTCTVTWDDQSVPTTATATGSGTAKVCSSSHTFNSAGVYTIGIAVSDGDGGAAQATTQVIVTDPTAGWVRGNGRHFVPAGTVKVQPTAEGNATFSFAARYLSPSSLRGQLTYRLRSAGFSFTAMNFQWLVVANPRLHLAGTGAVNGEANHAFLLTGSDGQAAGGDGTDRLRLKVWNSVDGRVVLDSTLDAAATDDIDNALPTPIQSGKLEIR